MSSVSPSLLLSLPSLLLRRRRRSLPTSISIPIPISIPIIGGGRRDISKRYFFSFFNNNNNNSDNDNENEYDTKVNTTEHDIADTNDWENKYRRPITTEIWNEFRKERQRTRHYLSQQASQPQPQSQSPPHTYHNNNTSYRTMYHEIQDTHLHQLSSSSQSSSLSDYEYGPTGKWMYRYELLAQEVDNDMNVIDTVNVNDNHRRVYQRYLSSELLSQSSAQSSSSSSQLQSQSQSQLVLELESQQQEIISMSLTPDETCIAYLLHRQHEHEHEHEHEQHDHKHDIPGSSSSSSPSSSTDNEVVKIRNINSGREMTLSTAELLSSNSVVSLEWGPAIVRQHKDAEVSSSLDQQQDHLQHHTHSYQSLYFVLADTQGRPNRVVACMIDPASFTMVPSQKGNQQPFLVYQNDNPAVFVDVQRTKGCHYVAIRVMFSKSSNEIYLCNAPSQPLVVVKPRQEGVLYHLDVGVNHDLVMLLSEETKNEGNYVLQEYTINDTNDNNDNNNNTKFVVGSFDANSDSILSLPLPHQEEEEDNEEKGERGGEHEDNYFIEDMDIFRNHIVLYERSKINCDQRIRVCHRRHRNRHRRNNSDGVEHNNNNNSNTNDKVGGEEEDDDDDDNDDTIIDLSSLSVVWSKLSPVGNICFDVNFFRFVLESPFTPGIVYEYNFDTQQITNISANDTDTDTDTSSLHRSAAAAATTTTTSSTIHTDSTSSSKSKGSSNQPLSSFVKEKVFVQSMDGTSVPLSLFYKNQGDDSDVVSSSPSSSSLPLSSTTTTTVVLVGYGSYGEPMDLAYNPCWRPLVDRGVVLAFAHTRGGGDCGKAWYRNGRQEKKINAIHDYEACAHYLKYTHDYNYNYNENENGNALFDGSKGRRRGEKSTSSSSVSLIAKAFSAGGVVVGACVNRHPTDGLFDKVILTNAFVDVYQTMKNTNLFLTEHEYDEFGNPTPICATPTTATADDNNDDTDDDDDDPNPHKADMDAIIRSYCPIYNIKPKLQLQSSTRFLIIGTLDDSNVPYWNATLYFKKLTLLSRNNINKEQRVFLELQTEGGHNFSSSSKNQMEVMALENAFILQQ